MPLNDAADYAYAATREAEPAKGEEKSPEPAASQIATSALVTAINAHKSTSPVSPDRRDHIDKIDDFDDFDDSDDSDDSDEFADSEDDFDLLEDLPEDFDPLAEMTQELDFPPANAGPLLLHRSRLLSYSRP